MSKGIDNQHNRPTHFVLYTAVFHVWRSYTTDVNIINFAGRCRRSL